MSKIAFLGLGQMGTPMAMRLLEAGHDVRVWNRDHDRTVALSQRGASVAVSPSDAAADVEFAITMLATPEAVNDVLFGPSGLAETLGPGQILIEMSTIGPKAFRSVAARLPDGVGAVDAPVRGSVPAATSGRLDIFVGAANDDFERVRPILQSLGVVRHIGAPGSGAAMKLVVNATLGAAIVAFGEALALATSLSLDRTAVHTGSGLDVDPEIRQGQGQVRPFGIPPAGSGRTPPK